VAIKASSSKQIDALMADLAAANAVTREAAIARLTVTGARGVERVAALALSPSSSGAARVAAFRTLEGIGDPRALEPALQAIADADPDVATAAIAVARIFVRSARGAAAVDRLTAVTLDRRQPEAVRLAGLRALRDLDAATVAPVLASLADDPNVAVRTAAAQPARRPIDIDPLEVLARAAEEALPDDPDTVRQAIARAGGLAPLPHLLRIVERAREREGSGLRGRRSDEWATARAAAHVALAQRGSRIAVYDLRESLERARAPLPVAFLTALSLIGDASCLEAIAAAHARTRDTWWRDHLADAFRVIAAREKITRRHAVIKKIERKWKGGLEELWAGGAGKAGR
jgi:HEAT repeat protein